MNNKTLKPFGLGFQYPTNEEIKHVIAKSNYTGGQIADLLGVNSRKVREWQSGTKRIEYSEWRLLLGLLGYVSIKQIPKGTKTIIFLYVDNKKLCVTNDENDTKDHQVIGQSTIFLPFFIENIPQYLNDLLKQCANSDDVLKSISVLAKENFNKNGGLAFIFN